MSVIDRFALHDPRETLLAQLKALDAIIAAARGRQLNGSPHPDGLTQLKAEARADELIAAYRATALMGADTIATLDRAKAIAELEAVLAVWKDPSVSDEAWLAARTGKAPAAKRAGRPGVKRGRTP